MRNMTAVLSQMCSPASLEPREIWYVHNAEVRSLSAASEARRIASCIRQDSWPDGHPGQQAIFRAMHTCAHRASEAGRLGKREPTRRKWAADWRLIREYIVAQNLGLVYKTLTKFDTTRLDADSLLSDGMYALGRAVDRFDPWRGYHFSTYACNSIIRAMMRRKRRETRYREAYPIQYQPDLEQPEHSHDQQNGLYVERLRLILRDNAAQLTNIEWGVLHRRFLCDGTRQLTFEAIGDEIGLSKERVRQIQNTALRKLRDSLSDDPVLR